MILVSVSLVMCHRRLPERATRRSVAPGVEQPVVAQTQCPFHAGRRGAEGERDVEPPDAGSGTSWFSSPVVVTKWQRLIPKLLVATSMTPPSRGNTAGIFDWA
ncbi:hypothetical protein ACIBHY_39460 [Nonomuraea sp. NPDC050547]|uniref:hypothetical protein n=1 Tax=Nonomuraea sp. NPDC050547 TaxID=3364368 RepID=UPI0037AA5266